jgi:competence protein ComEC
MLASVVASLAAEIALLPISAQTFSRVTIAGLLLNLLAVPLMGVVQMAGMATVAFDRIEALALAAAACGHGGASLLVGSARLVEIAPWLTARVAPPGAGLIAVYYGALVAALAGRRRVVRIAGAAATACAMGAIVTGARAAPAVSSPDSRLRLTMFDVGQAEALLLQFQGHRLLIDSGGVPFGAGGFDIGARVLAPALWASGVRSLDALLVTHGDPDHLGGAQAMLAAFDPAAFWEGIHVPSHRPMRDLRHAAARSGAQLFERRAGENLSLGPVRIRVLHPPEPDWERQRVRNDDSVVLEVVHGDVAVLLTGDITAAIERSLLPRLTPARTRILKVAHHGSRTSTSRELVDAWRPQVALISAGRGNTFGHPAPDVVRRLEEAGATILRTDRHGQITVDTDGTRVSYRTRVSP